jgi:transaldolase
MTGDVKPTYWDWVRRETATRWWHDSADRAELDCSLQRGATGVTTNPVLIATAIKSHPDQWTAVTRQFSRDQPAEARADALTQAAVCAAAEKLLPIFQTSDRRSGWVCAQVNPSRVGDRACMLAMAQRFHRWAPNIAVKLPATSAGLDVLEDCIADGITVTATVSFTVPQALEIAERHRAGVSRAERRDVTPGRCFAVLMVGRLDDYLREVAHDSNAQLAESDIRQAGVAVAKRAYSLYQSRGYEATLLVAAIRGSYHLTELAGGDLVLSIHPSQQAALESTDLPHEARIDHPVPAETLDRLRCLPDFVRAYEPDGMTAAEFITFGATQRTLSQFVETGWKELELLAAGSRQLAAKS